MSETQQLDLDYLRTETAYLADRAYRAGSLERSDVHWLVGAIADLIAEVERLSR